jgi:hypothetical protein
MAWLQGDGTTLPWCEPGRRTRSARHSNSIASGRARFARVQRVGAGRHVIAAAAGGVRVQWHYVAIVLAGFFPKVESDT